MRDYALLWHLDFSLTTGGRFFLVTVALEFVLVVSRVLCLGLKEDLFSLN